MPPLRVHHLVEPELNEARGWYAGRSPWAAENFARRFDATLGRVATRPRSHAPWRSIFRRARVPHFPYQLLFHSDARRTSVLMLVHTRREPAAVFETARNRLSDFR
ncbi:MAG: hypothetical protein RLZZ15_1174 [Verrucomicrobiota bacterium]|jgi:hypothetical protein